MMTLQVAGACRLGVERSVVASYVVSDGGWAGLMVMHSCVVSCGAWFCGRPGRHTLTVLMPPVSQ